jgi:hypothetical protein
MWRTRDATVATLIDPVAGYQQAAQQPLGAVFDLNSAAKLALDDLFYQFGTKTDPNWIFGDGRASALDPLQFKLPVRGPFDGDHAVSC